MLRGRSEIRFSTMDLGFKGQIRRRLETRGNSFLLLNLSRHGICVETDSLYNIGETVLIQCGEQMDSILFRGTVRWTEESENGLIKLGLQVRPGLLFREFVNSVHREMTETVANLVNG